MPHSIIQKYHNASQLQKAIFANLIEDIYESVCIKTTLKDKFEAIYLKNEFERVGVIGKKYFLRGQRLGFIQNKEVFLKSLINEEGEIRKILNDIVVPLSKHSFLPYKKEVQDFLNQDSGVKIVGLCQGMFSENLKYINEQRELFLENLIDSNLITRVSSEKIIPIFFQEKEMRSLFSTNIGGLLKDFLYESMDQDVGLSPNMNPSWRQIKEQIKQHLSRLFIFTSDPTKIHKLYEEIHGRGEQYNTMQFSENGELSYQGKIVKFTQYTMQFYVLDSLFNKKHPEFPHIYAAYDSRGDVDDFLDIKQIRQVENAIHGINKRLKIEFPKEKQFFGCEKGSVAIKIGKK